MALGLLKFTLKLWFFIVAKKTLAFTLIASFFIIYTF